MPLAADIYYHVYQEEANLPVVLLHGAGGSYLSWPADIRHLAGFRVFALDLPGHGKSPGRGRQSVAAYAQAVKDWLQAVGLNRAVFVGHSMGSGIAQLLGLDSPEQVIGLVLFGAATRLAVNPALLDTAASATTFNNAVENIVAWSFNPSADDRMKELVVKRMAEIRPSVLHGDLMACDGFDVTERVSEISFPTLVLCGADDKMTPIRNSQFLADHIAGASLEVVPEAGHMVMLEKPQEVVNALAKFLVQLEYL